MEASKSCVCRHRCLIILLIVAVLMSNMPSSTARPEGSSQLTDRYCARSAVQQEICQKCAKITKSKVVYPMCCNEEEGVYKWCTEYVNFGDHAT